LEFSIVDPAMI